MDSLENLGPRIHMIVGYFSLLWKKKVTSQKKNTNVSSVSPKLQSRINRHSKKENFSTSPDFDGVPEDSGQGGDTDTRVLCHMLGGRGNYSKGQGLGKGDV